MIVVADTSPLNYLVQLGIAGILPRLYDEICLPCEVLRELQDIAAPAVVRRWALQLPEWLTVRSATLSFQAELAGLDPGEREAISLALELGAGLLLDERKARKIASERFGMTVTGTVGILRDAHIAGFLDGVEMFDRLCLFTNFRRSPGLEADFLASINVSPSC